MNYEEKVALYKEEILEKSAFWGAVANTGSKILGSNITKSVLGSSLKTKALGGAAVGALGSNLTYDPNNAAGESRFSNMLGGALSGAALGGLAHGGSKLLPGATTGAVGNAAAKATTGAATKATSGAANTAGKVKVSKASPGGQKAVKVVTQKPPVNTPPPVNAQPKTPFNPAEHAQSAADRAFYNNQSQIAQNTSPVKKTKFNPFAGITGNNFNDTLNAVTQRNADEYSELIEKIALEIFGSQEKTAGEARQVLQNLRAFSERAVKDESIRPDSNYNQKQLEKGVKVEHEHTNDSAVAKTIAKDHLDELKDYYTRLEKMEG